MKRKVGLKKKADNIAILIWIGCGLMAWLLLSLWRYLWSSGILG